MKAIWIPLAKFWVQSAYSDTVCLIISLGGIAFNWWVNTELDPTLDGINRRVLLAEFNLENGFAFDASEHLTSLAGTK